MIPASVDAVFVVGFSVFVVAFVVLIVLTVRFLVGRARAEKRQWLAEQEDLDAADQIPGPDPEPAGPVTALVLSGGGPRGAAQVGMLQVLAEGGFVPDRIYGVSVGAVNGAAFANNPTVEGVEYLTQIWRELRSEDIFPQRLGHGPWRFLQQRESIHPNSGLRQLIEEGIGFELLEESAIPIEVVATSIVDGRERWLTSGSAVEAILASAAIPAIYPPVEIDGDRLIDGAVVDNVPIGRAIDAGAERIVVLLSGPPNYSPLPFKRPVEAMLNALLISVHARFTREMARLPNGVEVVVCSVEPSESREYSDFSDTEALMAAGRAEAVDVFVRHGVIDPPPKASTAADSGVADPSPVEDGVDSSDVPPERPAPAAPANVPSEVTVGLPTGTVAHPVDPSPH
jgi:NTE family protein